MANHPKEFKRGTWYWLRAGSGHWHATFYNAGGEWKLDDKYFKHELFMKLMKDVDIVEAVMPSP